MQYVMRATMGRGGAGQGEGGQKKKHKYLTHPVPVLIFLNNYSAVSITLYKAIVMIDIYLHGSNCVKAVTIIMSQKQNYSALSSRVLYAITVFFTIPRSPVHTFELPHVKIMNH